MNIENIKNYKRQTYHVFLESGFFTWDGKSIFEQIILRVVI